MNSENDIMMEGTYKTAGGAIIAWIGTFGSYMSKAHEFLSLVCVITSIIATGYAIRVAIATLHSKRIEDARNETTICKDCVVGNPPPFCPFDEHEKPPYCLKKKAKL